jgi:hypothetical protein
MLLLRAVYDGVPDRVSHMTKVYDFSVTDIREHNFEFGEMSESEIAEKKKLLEEHQKNKVARLQQRLLKKRKQMPMRRSRETCLQTKNKTAGPPPS